MDPNTLNEMRSVAVQAALQAGKLAREKWTQPRQVSEKGFRDLVTDADFASQALIVEIIRSHYPDHGFLGEESASDLPVSGPVIWVIDPIDGTTNYSHLLPIYCISIAAINRPSLSANPGEPELLIGIIYDPMQDELFEAAAGHGAYLNGNKIQASDITDLNRAIVALDWSHNPAKRQTTLEMMGEIAHRVHTLRAIGSAALALAWIAAGRLDGYFNLNLKPWDVAAGKLLISEAGGQFITIDDQPWYKEDIGCIAANNSLASELKANLLLTPD